MSQKRNSSSWWAKHWNRCSETIQHGWQAACAWCWPGAWVSGGSRLVRHWCHATFRLLRWLVLTLQSLYRTRFRYLIQGLPALLVALATLVFAIHVVRAPREQALERYLPEARRALSAGDYAKARICYERLSLTERDKPEIRFELALTVEALGEMEWADALMAPLAPLEKQGYLPAHQWVGRRLLQGGRDLPRQAQQAAEVHLLRVVQAQPDELETSALLGGLYFKTGRYQQAEPYLLRAAPRCPEVRLALGHIYRLQGKMGSARAQYVQAQDHCKRLAETMLDNHQARLQWAEAVRNLDDDFRGAAKILEEGCALAPHDSYRPTLGLIHALWSDSLQPREARLGERLDLLERGLKHDPKSVPVLDRLIALTHQSGPEADRARVALRGVLTQGKASAVAHVLLGIDAWKRKEAGTAQLHLEQAFQLAPEMPAVANNLAWMLAHRPQADLPRSLELIQLVLARWPDEPSFRDTRGQILVKQGRWKESLTDLEFALKTLQDKPHVHQALALAYENVRQPELAAEHRRLAMEKNVSPESRKTP